jgi:four helix bundle protein
MDRKTLEDRTKKFHIEVINACKSLPKNAAGFETAKQIIRAAGSVGANYRASKRSKSRGDFRYKISVVLEESDESLYWLEVIKESELLVSKNVDFLIKEANELTAIFAATLKSIQTKI